jgi:hypothetical protein
MSSSPQPQAPSPGIIFDTLQAYQRSVALKAGIDLDLFTAIAEGSHSLSAIAARIKASEKGTLLSWTAVHPRIWGPWPIS